MLVTLLPYMGIDLGEDILKFGDPARKVRQVLGPEDDVFKRGLDDHSSSTFRYESRGFFLEISDKDELLSFEFFSPGMPMFFEQNLLAMPYSEIKDLILQHDSTAVEEEIGSMFSYKLGIGTYAPHADEEPHNSVESIILFTRGYYEH